MSSCFCKGTNVPYVSINNIQFENYHVLDGFIAGNKEIRSDDFRLSLRINCDFVAMNPVSLPLIDRAYATACDPGEGVRGLKSDITKLEITCDDRISGIDAGQNLVSSDMMSIYFLNNRHQMVEMSVAEWIKNMNDNEGFGDYSPHTAPFRQWNQEYFLYFKEDVATDTFVRFKIYIELDNEQSFEHETAQIKII
jgi:hypothetical protein